MTTNYERVLGRSKRQQPIGPTAVAFRFQVKVNRQRELRREGTFPEPDHMRTLGGEGDIQIPYWYPSTIEQFLKDHPEEDNRKPYHRTEI